MRVLVVGVSPHSSKHLTAVVLAGLADAPTTHELTVEVAMGGATELAITITPWSKSAFEAIRTSVLTLDPSASVDSSATRDLILIQWGEDHDDRLDAVLAYAAKNGLRDTYLWHMREPPGRLLVFANGRLEQANPSTLSGLRAAWDHCEPDENAVLCVLGEQRFADIAAASMSESWLASLWTASTLGAE